MLALAAIAALVFSKGGDKAPAADIVPTVTISMTKDGFSPNTSSIKLGEAVMFRNDTASDFFWPASDLHPTHELYPEFDPRMPIEPGGSWTFVFERVGNWSYHDHLYARKKGLITVTQ